MTRGEVPLKPLYCHTRRRMTSAMAELVIMVAVRKKKQRRQLVGSFCY